MSEGPGFLEFFILEASDYVEQLDGLLLGSSSNGPDADAMQRVARALRGAATMAKLPSFAGVAGSVERVGRSLQDGLLRWDPALGVALVAAVDDLKTLLHSARRWSPSEDARANQRSAELERFSPSRETTTLGASSEWRGAGAGSAFLAAEASNIAAGLELLNTRTGAADTAANLLRRIRALRGVAGVKEIGPLAEVLEVTEDATRGLESGETKLTPEARNLFENAVEYLRVISSALRYGGDADAPNPTRDAFLAAQERWTGKAREEEQVVPIASLFYADAGPGVVQTSDNPPTSAANRFRLELVAHGEHLRQIADAARRSSDLVAMDRVQRDLRRALKGIEITAESFGEHAVADAIRGRTAALEGLDPAGLRVLDEVASALVEPAERPEAIADRLRALSVAEVAPPPAPAAVSESAIEPESTSELTERTEPTEPISLAAEPIALIDSGLAALEALTSAPWIPPVPIPEDIVVPIESLLYRARAALDRAVEVRDQLRSGGSPMSTDALEELFDLVELARTE